MAETTQPLELALEAALIIIQNGGSTVAAERSLTYILKAYETERVSVVWRLDLIAATRATEGQPSSQSSTFLRPVGPVGSNLARASAAATAAERAARGEIAIAALGAELERIKRLPSPYPRWVTVAAAALSAASFSQLNGGDWSSLGIALVAAGGGQFLRTFLQARKLAVAPVTLLCGLLSAMVAGVGLRLGLSQVAPANLVASVIYLIPGLALINGFLDVASHKYILVGIERIANAALLFLTLAVAIAVTDLVVL